MDTPDDLVKKPDETGFYCKLVVALTVVAALIRGADALGHYLARSILGPIPPSATAAGRIFENSAASVVFVFGSVLVFSFFFFKGKPGSDRHGNALIRTATASSIVGACLAAARGLDNGWFLFCGFALGVAACVYALVKEVDDLVPPGKLLAITLVQIMSLFLLLG